MRGLSCKHIILDYFYQAIIDIRNVYWMNDLSKMETNLTNYIKVVQQKYYGIEAWEI